MTGLYFCLNHIYQSEEAAEYSYYNIQIKYFNLDSSERAQSQGNTDNEADKRCGVKRKGQRKSSLGKF